MTPLSSAEYAAMLLKNGPPPPYPKGRMTYTNYLQYSALWTEWHRANVVAIEVLVPGDACNSNSEKIRRARGEKLERFYAWLRKQGSEGTSSNRLLDYAE